MDELLAEAAARADAYVAGIEARRVSSWATTSADIELSLASVLEAAIDAGL